MAMNAVTIDANWLTAAGSAPYNLSQDNTVYTLGVDVNVTSTTLFGQIFQLTGKNVELVLNGHTVRLNGAYYPQITDSLLYRRTSEYTVRPVPTAEGHMFGGTVGTGRTGYEGPVIPPNSPEYPPLVSWARTK